MELLVTTTSGHDRAAIRVADRGLRQWNGTRVAMAERVLRKIDDGKGRRGGIGKEKQVSCGQEKEKSSPFP